MYRYGGGSIIDVQVLSQNESSVTVKFPLDPVKESQWVLFSPRVGKTDTEKPNFRYTKGDGLGPDRVLPTPVVDLPRPIVST